MNVPGKKNMHVLAKSFLIHWQGSVWHSTFRLSRKQNLYYNIIQPKLVLSALSLIRRSLSFLSICRLSPCQIPSFPRSPHYLRLCAQLLLHQVDQFPPCVFLIALITISDAKAAADRLAREVAKQGYQSLE